MDDEIELAEAIDKGLSRLASAILPGGTFGGNDATGGYVLSLTEAVMGVTGGLIKIAEAITDLADAVRDHPG